MWTQIEGKDRPANCKVGKKAVGNSGLNCWSHTRLPTSPGIFRCFLWLLNSFQNADIKQIDCQIFLQERWVYSGSAEFYFRVFNHEEPHRSPHIHEKEPSFIEGKRELDDCSQWRVHGFFVDWVCARKQEVSFFLLGSVIIAEYETFFLILRLYLIEVSTYYYYYYFYIWIQCSMFLFP